MVRGKVLLSILVMVGFACDVLVEKSHAVWVNLPAAGTKCVYEEIHQNVVVLADYLVISDFESNLTAISVKVIFVYYLQILCFVMVSLCPLHSAHWWH